MPPSIKSAKNDSELFLNDLILATSQLTNHSSEIFRALQWFICKYIVFHKNSPYKSHQAENRQIFKKVLRVIVRLILYFPCEILTLGGFNGKNPTFSCKLVSIT